MFLLPYSIINNLQPLTSFMLSPHLLHPHPHPVTTQKYNLCFALFACEMFNFCWSVSIEKSWGVLAVKLSAELSAFSAMKTVQIWADDWEREADEPSVEVEEMRVFEMSLQLKTDSLF